MARSVLYLRSRSFMWVKNARRSCVCNYLASTKVGLSEDGARIGRGLQLKTCAVSSEGAERCTGSGANQARSYWISTRTSLNFRKS